MVFSKFSKFFSSTALSFTNPKASVSYKPSGLPPIPGSHHNFTYSSPKKANLRFSSSLQDLSTYYQVDPENGLSPGLESSPSHAVPQKFLQQENGTSSFSKEKPVSSTRKSCLRVFYVLCLLLFACLCLGSVILYANWTSGSSNYYVVLDCGSTGTRVYVYQASINDRKDDRFPILVKSLPESFKSKSGSQIGRAYNRMETEPGFDKLVHNTSGMRKVIKPLIKWAEKQIPKKSHKSTSLFLYATAGVRRLPPADSNWLLDNAWSILKTSHFMCKREWVKTITGMEEAYYGWISLNYHTGVLGSIPRMETYGALDLGGSSLQVTFENNLSSHEESSLKLSIGSVNNQLSAYSLSGYGLNDAFDKSVAHLLKNLPHINNADLLTGRTEIEHPCLHTGYKEQYSCSQCSSVGLKDGNSPSEGKSINEKGKKPGVSVKLIGNPKWDECTALAKVAVNLSEWSNLEPGLDCELQPCALAENLPRPKGQFYAMSGFYVVYRFFNLTPVASLDDVLEKGREFCGKNWDVARKSVVAQPFIEQYCFRAPYIALLLREGLHISDSNVIVGSGSITWTLGVALSEAGKAFFPHRFYGYPIFMVRMSPFVVLGVLFASLFVLVCAISYVGNWWVPNLFRRAYVPLFRHNSGATNSVLNIPSPFRFQRWSPINAGDGRVKMPLSPTVAATPQQRPFDSRLNFGGGGIQFAESSSFYSSSSSAAHSYSSGSLGQMQQFDHNALGPFWTPHRGQMRLQSRRSQSREDLNSSLAEAHLAKV
ncbi:Probable apyrase 7 [Striga hermonthica]|uniref:Probable apyrase 7 n=1 Tax=Striga hermonthica TaxID=68872 RepID=A0A9N7RNJ7_STRHE|nr:Probable apyrase 7 [Striga hermonthica]